MNPIELSVQAARSLQIAASGLYAEPARPSCRADALAAIRQMGVLQIDTIHVVARSPYLVLWSRLGDYDPRWLDELLAAGDLFEYWSHAACFIPGEDFPYYRRLMLENRRGWGDNQAWLDAHAGLAARVLDQIRAEGPLRSADFEPQNGRRKSDGWWDWKEEKIALDRLHTAGELMIRERRNFQRVYDLTARVLPDWDDANAPSFEDTWRALTLKAVRCLGLAAAAWVPDYFRMPKRGSVELLDQLAGEGALLRASVEGLKAPIYLHPDNLPLAEAAAGGRLAAGRTVVLSPFDPLVWDRARGKALFGFDFSLECYLPAEKRRYGYFLLPVLHNGALVARMDAKAHRGDGLFEIRGLFLEPGADQDETLAAGLAAALRRCAAWHGTPEVVLRTCEPAAFGPRLENALRESPDKAV